MLAQQAERPIEVQSRALSSDGKIAVSYGADGVVTLWDTRTGQDIRKIQAYEANGFLSSTDSALFSPSNKLLFTLGRIKQQVLPGGVGQISTTMNGVQVTQTTQGKLWDLSTGKLLWTHPEMDDGVKGITAVNTAVFSPNGKLLATKARYGPIHLWDIGTGKLLRTLRTPFINLDALAFSPDGKTLAGGGYHSTSYSSEILLWNVRSGELERSLKQPDSAQGTQIQTIAFSPNGKLLAVGGGAGQYERINEISGRFNPQYGVAQLWDVKSGVLLTTVGHRVHRVNVTTLAFSPDGTRIATGSEDFTVGLWDTRIGNLQGTVTRYGGEKATTTTETKPVGSNALFTGPRSYGFGTNGINTNITETRTSDPQNAGLVTVKRTTKTTTGYGVRDLAFSGGGKTLNILSYDKSVRAWDVASPTPQSDPVRRVLPNGGSSYSAVAFAPNSRWLVSGESRKQVRFWTADDLEETKSFIAHDDAIVKVALAPFAPDDVRFAEKAPLLATGSNILKWTKLTERSSRGVANGFEVKLWNSQNQELLHTLAVPDFALTALVVSPGGQWVAASGAVVEPPPAGVRLINAGFEAGDGGTGAATNATNDATNAPDAKPELAGVVMLWNAKTGELQQKFPLTGDIPLDLAFSPDGSSLASDCGKAGVTLWNTATGAALRTLGEDVPLPLKPGERRMNFRSGTPDAKATLAFASNGTQLARSRQGVVQFWNVETGVLVKTLVDAEAPNSKETEALALNPNGQTLATASRQQLKLWDIASGKLLWKSPVQNSISLLKMAPNGKTLATNADWGIRLWDISKAAEGIVN